MTSPTSPTPKTRPRRESRFTEGSESTRPDILQFSLTPASPSNELFFTILSEMDEHEKKRQREHRGSNSSFDSFDSSHGLPNTSANSQKEGRRNIGPFGRRSLDDRPMGFGSGLGGFSVGFGGNGMGLGGMGNGREGVEAVVSKVKGRLRALTGERRKDVKPYPGT